VQLPCRLPWSAILAPLGPGRNPTGGGPLSPRVQASKLPPQTCLSHRHSGISQLIEVLKNTPKNESHGTRVNSATGSRCKKNPLLLQASLPSSISVTFSSANLVKSTARKRFARKFITRAFIGTQSKGQSERTSLEEFVSSPSLHPPLLIFLPAHLSAILLSPSSSLRLVTLRLGHSHGPSGYVTLRLQPRGSATQTSRTP
jgi:hypothetical protein